MPGFTLALATFVIGVAFLAWLVTMVALEGRRARAAKRSPEAEGAEEA
jgi:hypothetical protein